MHIKTKILLSFSFLLLLFIVFSLIIYQYSSDIYNKILEKSIAEALEISVKKIKESLAQVEDLSTEIITTQINSQYDFQKNIKQLGLNTSLYGKYDLLTDLMNYLKIFFYREDYLKGIYLIDTNENVYKAVPNQDSLNPDLKNRIIKDTAAKNGSHAWFAYSINGEKTSLYSAQYIKNIADMSLEGLGAIVLEIDFAKIINSLDLKFKRYEIGLAIYYRQNPVYSTVCNLDFNDVLKYVNSNDGYFSYSLGDKNYFTTFLYSEDKSWLYTSFLDYNVIYRQKLSLNIFIIIAYLILLLIVGIFSSMFTNSISVPITRLASVMQQVEYDSFKVKSEELFETNKGDEIGILYKEFKIMVQKIETLINENYKKQIAIQESKYKALQAQINPHFLYNTLESINMVAAKNKQLTISEMIRALSNLLREAIDQNEEVITIRDELAILNNYLTIQKFRFKERLVISIDFEKSLMDFAIPKFSIQPIVENSIIYGVEALTKQSKIEICGKCSNNIVSIVISDNGMGISKQRIKDIMDENYKSKSIGLKNIHNRLKLLFGKEYGVSILSNRGTKIELYFPPVLLDELLVEE